MSAANRDVEKRLVKQREEARKQMSEERERQVEEILQKLQCEWFEKLQAANEESKQRQREAKKIHKRYENLLAESKKWVLERQTLQNENAKLKEQLNSKKVNSQKTNVFS